MFFLLNFLAVMNEHHDAVKSAQSVPIVSHQHPEDGLTNTGTEMIPPVVRIDAIVIVTIVTETKTVGLLLQLR